MASLRIICCCLCGSRFALPAFLTWIFLGLLLLPHAPHWLLDSRVLHPDSCYACRRVPVMLCVCTAAVLRCPDAVVILYTTIPFTTCQHTYTAPPLRGHCPYLPLLLVYCSYFNVPVGYLLAGVLPDFTVPHAPVAQLVYCCVTAGLCYSNTDYTGFRWRTLPCPVAVSTFYPVDVGLLHWFTAVATAPAVLDCGLLPWRITVGLALFCSTAP